MKNWLDEQPLLQRIILFFKYVLWYYGFNENYKGGICSYCVFIMVTAFLVERYPDSESQKELNQESMLLN